MKEKKKQHYQLMKEVIKKETGYNVKKCNTTYENVIVIKCFNNELFFSRLKTIHKLMMT